MAMRTGGRWMAGGLMTLLLAVGCYRIADRLSSSCDDILLAGAGDDAATDPFPTQNNGENRKTSEPPPPPPDPKPTPQSFSAA